MSYEKNRFILWIKKDKLTKECEISIREIFLRSKYIAINFTKNKKLNKNLKADTCQRINCLVWQTGLPQHLSVSMPIHQNHHLSLQSNLKNYLSNKI